ADGAARDIADPALDRLTGEGADQLTDDAAADRACDRVAQGPERILLCRCARGTAADRAGHGLNEKTREIHLPTPLYDSASNYRPCSSMALRGTLYQNRRLGSAKPTEMWGKRSNQCALAESHRARGWSGPRKFRQVDQVRY